MNINKLLLTGNLVADPELTPIKNGKNLVKVPIANNDSYLSDSGERHSVTTFIEIQVWGKSAEAFAKMARKGQEIWVDGQLRLEQWTDSQGANHSRHVVRVESWQFTQFKRD